MRIEVSGYQFIFPSVCACCEGTATDVLTVSASKQAGEKVVRTKTNTWDFPYCSQCLQHVRTAESAVNAGAAWSGIGIIGGLLLWFSVHPILGGIVAIGGIVLGVFYSNKLMEQARNLCTPTCACAERSVAFLDWDGTRNVFEVKSRSYALRFMEANQKKLVNLSSEAQQLLQANGSTLSPNAPQRARRYTQKSSQ